MPPSSDETQFINVALPKNCILRLPIMVYAEGLKRGRRYQRAMQQAAREHAMGVQHEADRLEWIAEE
jgi:hypothetical protein